MLGLMRRWRTFLGLIVLSAGAAQGAIIYKWTDAQGVIHYSDQPVPGALRIDTGGSPVSAGPGGAAPAAAAAPAKPAAGVRYSVLTVESPTAEQAFFGNVDVPVRLHLEPALQPGHVVAWFLNGERVEDQGPQSVAFALHGLPRGAYTIGATVTDPDTGVAQSSDPVAFYVQQPSLLSPQHPKP